MNLVHDTRKTTVETMVQLASKFTTNACNVLCVEKF